jgi:membrane protein
MNHEARLQELKLELARLGDRGSKLWRGVEHERGREAEHPAAIPPRGWRDILVRAWREVSDENLFLLAGGVTYAILLALFPGLAALVALYGLVFDATQIEKQVSALSGFVPGQTEEILSQELHGLVESSNGSLGFAAALGLLLALWSASRGMSGLVSAINTAYGEKERRGFLKLNLIVIGLTLGLLIGGTLTIALVAVLPAAIQFLAVGSATKWLLLIVQWPLLIVLVMVGLGVLYRFCPDRNKPQWRWVSPGAIAATVLWIVASIGFTIYCRSSIEKSQFLPDRNVTPAADDFIRHTAP